MTPDRFVFSGIPGQNSIRLSDVFKMSLKETISYERRDTARTGANLLAQILVSGREKVRQIFCPFGFFNPQPKSPYDTTIGSIAIFKAIATCSGKTGLARIKIGHSGVPYSTARSSG